MSTVTRYAIENIETGERVRTFGALPKSFDLPDGRRVVSPVAVGDEGLGYRLIQIDEVDFASPGPYYTQGEDTETRDGAVVTITRSWEPWPQEEIDAYEAARDNEQSLETALRAASVIAARQMVLDEEQSEDERAELIGVYPLWVAGEAAAIGDHRRFAGALYRCVQAHTTQADWTPPSVPALWTAVFAPTVIGAWVQPTGAHDAYNTGDLVSHNGKVWVSTLDANVWEPGVAGWEVQP